MAGSIEFVHYNAMPLTIVNPHPPVANTDVPIWSYARPSYDQDGAGFPIHQGPTLNVTHLVLEMTARYDERVQAIEFDYGRITDRNPMSVLTPPYHHREVQCLVMHVRFTNVRLSTINPRLTLAFCQQVFAGLRGLQWERRVSLYMIIEDQEVPWIGWLGELPAQPNLPPNPALVGTSRGNVIAIGYSR